MGQYSTTRAAAPIKYYPPGPEDQYMQNREAICQAVSGDGVWRVG